MSELHQLIKTKGWGGGVKKKNHGNQMPTSSVPSHSALQTSSALPLPTQPKAVCLKLQSQMSNEATNYCVCDECE